MNEKIKCVNNNCSECQEWLKEKLAQCEDWEVKRKESYQKFEFRFCPNQSEGGSKVSHSETGGCSYLACPNGCGKMYKKVTEFGDEKELEHECQTQTTHSSNQIPNKSSHMQERERERERESNSSAKPNYLLWILGGIGTLGLVGFVIYFILKNLKSKKGDEE